MIGSRLKIIQMPEDLIMSGNVGKRFLSDCKNVLRDIEQLAIAKHVLLISPSLGYVRLVQHNADWPSSGDSQSVQVASTYHLACT